jgi:hypothetical protein
VLSRVDGFNFCNNTGNSLDRDLIKAESCKNGTIHHNTIAGGDATLGYSGIHLAMLPIDNSVPTENIRIYENTHNSGGHHNAIQVNSSDSLTNVTKNIEIDHNHINGLAYGIEADGLLGVNNLNIHHNDFATISSAPIDLFCGGTGLFVNNNTKAGGVALSNQPTSITGSFTTEHYYL